MPTNPLAVRLVEWERIAGAAGEFHDPEFWPDMALKEHQRYVVAFPPALTTKLLAAVRALEGATAALNRFGHHSAGCATNKAHTWMHADAPECECGLRVNLKLARQALTALLTEGKE